MTTGKTFDPARRERLLTLLETGRNMEEACAAVGIARATVTKWASRGRAETDTEHAAFAARLDAAREGRSGADLSEDDLVRLLERSARQGSVRATELLLRRPWVIADPRYEPDAVDDLAARRRERRRRQLGVGA